MGRKVCIPRTLLAREVPTFEAKEDYVMTIDGVETLIKTTTRNKVRLTVSKKRVESRRLSEVIHRRQKPDDDLAHRGPTIAATHGHWGKARRRGCPMGLA